MNKPRRAMQPVPVEPRVRRAYFDCRYGQLHVHYAIPGGGGFDEATTLLCIPGLPGTGRFFRPLLLPLGRDRSVYAPDLPGSGESDPTPGPIGNAELAGALGDFLDSMHVRRVDVLAHAEGVGIALALLAQRTAQVGRLVLSPSSETVQVPARELRLPVLVIDLHAPESGNREIAELERQAGQLREFLELV